MSSAPHASHQANVYPIGINNVKYWKIIADNLSKAGWSRGWVSAIARSAQGVTHLRGLSAESRRGLDTMDNPTTPTPEDEV
jgi:hypothetical protein